jgi:hypothetical protein
MAVADVLIITAAQGEDDAVVAVAEGLIAPWEECADISGDYLIGDSLIKIE